MHPAPPCVTCLAQPAVKDFDEARQASRLLKQENTELASDKEHLQQQCESRSQHCMTLISENKRLVDQGRERPCPPHAELLLFLLIC